MSGLLEGIGNFSEEAAEIIDASSISSPIEVFSKNMSRARMLLSAGLKGVEHSKKTTLELIEKFSLDGKDGEFLEEGSDPIFEKTEDGYNVSLTKLQHEAVMKALDLADGTFSELPFYLHNILCVSIWASFEGYVQAALATIYRNNIYLLASDKKLSVSDVIKNRDSLVDYIVAKEIDDVGRRSFKDLQVYLKSQIKAEIPSKYTKMMSDIYFLRNVIAHSAGRLRSEQLSSVPEGVDIDGLDVKLSKDFLEKCMSCLEGAVYDFQKIISGKYTMKLLE